MLAQEADWKAWEAQENCKNPTERTAAGVTWWLFLGSQHVPVRRFFSWTGSVLVNQIYGIKECLSLNMLCGFVSASKDPSAAADLLPQLVALTLLQHLLVNYLLKGGIVLPAGCQLVSVWHFTESGKTLHLSPFLPSCLNESDVCEPEKWWVCQGCWEDWQQFKSHLL